MAQPHVGDNYWTLLYKFVQDMEPFVSDFVAPHIGDNLWTLQFKAVKNMANFSGSSSGPIPTIPTPSSINDFSGLPGGVAPPAGEDKVYWAVRDAATYWTIGSGDTQWTVVDKNNP